MKILRFSLMMSCVTLFQTSWAASGIDQCKSFIDLQKAAAAEGLIQCRLTHPDDPNYCIPDSISRSCVHQSNRMCSTYFLSEDGVVNTFWYWSDEDCFEPDLSAPPPIDPFSDPRDPIKPPQCSNPNSQ